MSYVWPVVILQSQFPIEVYFRLGKSSSITQFSLNGRILLPFESTNISDDLKTRKFSLFTLDNPDEISRYTFEVRKCKDSTCEVSIGFFLSVPVILEGRSFCQSIPDNDPLI